MIRLTQLVETVPLEKFLPELRFEAPEAPDPVLESYARQTIIQLAEDSMILKRELHVVTEPGCDTYLLEPKDGTHIWKLSTICTEDGRQIKVEKKPCAVGCSPAASWAMCPGCDSGMWAWFHQPNELRLSQTPTGEADCGLTITAIVVPDRDCCEVDELIYQRYAPAIHAGTLAALFQMPNKPWTSQTAARAKLLEFRAMTSRAFADGLVGAGGAVFRLTTRRFV